MVKRIFGFIGKEVSGLHTAAYLLGFFSILSQVLALIRDRLFAHIFGAGETLDIYYAAFRIPDFLFVSIASIVSVSVLIPFLVEKFDKGEEKEFLSSIFSFFVWLMLGVSVLVFILMPWLISLIYPGFKGNTELIELSRILLLSPILLGLSNLFGGITQVFKRFFIYALSPLLYNVGIIIGIMSFYPLFGLKGLGYGVVLGAFLHMAIQIPFLFRKKLIPRMRILPQAVELRKVVLTSLPRALTLGINHLALIVLLSFGSLMSRGSIAVFNLSFNLQSVPLSIIGVSYSLAAFPVLVRLYSSGDKDRFLEQVITSTRHIIFWSLPVMALFIVLRAQIVRVILGSGNFTWADTKLTAAALALFSISLLAQALILLFVRAFYSIGDTRTPLIANVVGAVLVVFFSLLFLELFTRNYDIQFTFERLLRVEDVRGTEVLMLILGYSLATCFNGFLLWRSFSESFSSFGKLVRRTLFEVLLSSLIIGVVAYEALQWFDNIFATDTFSGILLQGASAGITGVLAGLAVLLLFRSREIREIKDTLRRQIFGAPAIASESEML